MDSKTIELLDYASMWITPNVHADDIEHERQQMEAKYRKKLAVHTREIVSRSGAQCTRIEWKVVDA
jgi:hypothetical protein